MGHKYLRVQLAIHVAILYVINFFSLFHLVSLCIGYSLAAASDVQIDKIGRYDSSRIDRYICYVHLTAAAVRRFYCIVGLLALRQSPAHTRTAHPYPHVR